MVDQMAYLVIGRVASTSTIEAVDLCVMRDFRTPECTIPFVGASIRTLAFNACLTCRHFHLGVETADKRPGWRFERLWSGRLLMTGRSVYHTASH